MKQRIRTIGVLCGVIVWLWIPLSATAQSEQEIFEEQKESSGAQALWDQMPTEIKNQLSALGIHGIEVESITTLQPKTVAKGLWARVLEESARPLAIGGILIGTLVLCAAGSGMQTLSEKSSSHTVFQAACIMTLCATILPSLLQCIHRVEEAITGSTVFMGSFAPVYTAVIASSGKAASALSFQTVVLCVSEWLTVWIGRWITPLLTVALAMNVVGHIGSTGRLSSVGEWIHKVCVWGVGLVSTVFTGLLSLQTTVGSAADTLSARALRFSAANLIPVVGSAVSEALGTVQGCLGVLRSTLGGIGILVVVLLLLSPMISCIMWQFLLSIGGVFADMLLLKPMGDLLRSMAETVKTMIGVMAFCGLFMIIATAIVGKAVAGG